MEKINNCEHIWVIGWNGICNKWCKECNIPWYSEEVLDKV